MSTNWRRILIFLGITFAIDWALVGVVLAAGVEFTGVVATVVAMVYMVVPALVAFVLARRWRVRLRDYGVRMPRRWELALAPLVPMVIAGLCVVFAVLLDFGEFDPTGVGLVERMEAQGQAETADVVARGIDSLPINVILLAFLSAPIAGFTMNGLFAFGEELGWRGLLQRELAPLGFARASALIGVVWGLWHAPLILLGHNFPEHPRLGVLVMAVACVPLGIVFSWPALRAGNVFAAAVAHGTFNALAGVPLMAVRGGTNLEVSIVGYAGIAAMVVLAIPALIWRPRSATYEDEPAAPDPPAPRRSALPDGQRGRLSFSGAGASPARRAAGRWRANDSTGEAAVARNDDGDLYRARDRVP